MSETSETPCYIARCKCGCGGLIFASVQSQQMSKERGNDTAKEVSKLIRAGYSIERMTVGDVRAATWLCKKDRVHERLTPKEK